MSSLGDRLLVSIRALDQIARRLQASLDEDAQQFPVRSDTVRSPSGQAARARDAFLQRFQQMADHILRKLFPRTVAAMEGSADFMPIRDMLEILDRAGLIDAVDVWMGVIELRNRLTHDYALDSAELAQDLNAAWDIAPTLIAQITKIRAYALVHNLLDGASLDDH